MICPRCKADNDHVTDKRAWEKDGLSGDKRRRECKGCGERFTTLEIVITFGPDRLPILPGLNGHANGNGHKPAPKPKPQKPLTAEQRTLKKKLAMALHRARCKAVVIEDEDLE